jgi:hypothetical protein
MEMAFGRSCHGIVVCGVCVTHAVGITQFKTHAQSGVLVQIQARLSRPQ